MIASDFLSIRDFTPGEIREFIELARLIKSNPELFAESLKGKTLALIFEKPSLRTRVSFDVGIHQLGGFSLYLSPAEIVVAPLRAAAFARSRGACMELERDTMRSKPKARASIIGSATTPLTRVLSAFPSLRSRRVRPGCCARRSQTIPAGQSSLRVVPMESH